MCKVMVERFGLFKSGHLFLHRGLMDPLSLVVCNSILESVLFWRHAAVSYAFQNAFLSQARKQFKQTCIIITNLSLFRKADK